MRGDPLVTVLMSTYNSQSTIKEAVDSILNQTLLNFEFIIIDDASTDNTLKILKEYRDSRIKIIENKENKGLGYNLNYGINISKGAYIARMDSDDISLPQRFQKQVDYLNLHPDIICVGSRAYRFGNLSLFQKLFKRVMNQILSYDELKIQMLNGTPLLHPSVMFNGILLRKAGFNYSPTFRRAQDYELWTRMIWDFKMENMKDCLLKYRYSKSQASSRFRSEQIANSNIMYQRVLSKLLGRTVNNEEILTHSLFSTKNHLSHDEFNKVSHWIDILHDAVIVSSIFDEQSFNKIMAVRWAAICRASLKRKDRFFVFCSKPYFKKYLFKNYLRLLK